MAKNYTETPRPGYFSNKKCLPPSKRGDTGKGPLPRSACGTETRHTNTGKKEGGDPGRIAKD